MHVHILPSAPTDLQCLSLGLKRDGSREHKDRHVQVPTAAADFPKDLYHAPRGWIAQQYNLKQYSAFDSGGHFAALEEPDVLVEDINKFFKTIHL